MATRLKTVEYWFPMIATIADNVQTNASQITINIPESSLVFKTCVVDVIIDDANATAADISTPKTIGFRLGAAAYTTVNNTSTLTNSGENFTFMLSGDFTSHFTTNWSGTSMTADCYLTINGGATGFRNASIKVTITYEFNDTSSTHLKTVWIPLNAPAGALPATKSTIYDTVPALDTYLPEASKTYHQIIVVVQGNVESNSTTDISISMDIDSVNPYTSQLYEKGQQSDMWYRVNNDFTAMDTSTTHSFYLWASVTDFDHPQAWMVVTYSFNPASTTSIMNSLIMPMELDSPMGGTTSSDYQRGQRDIWIEEANPSGKRLAYYLFYDKAAAIAGLNCRVGTGAFVAYTDVAAVLAGGAGLMVRNDSAFTLARGRNTISFDVYRTDTTDLGYNTSGFWLVNYTSDVPSQGIWAANHTVRYNYKPIGTIASSVQTIITNTSLNVPELQYFYNSIGLNYIYQSSGSGTPAGVHIGAEILVAEGGLKWESIYTDIGGTDPEVGIRQCWATARSVYKRWGDEVNNIFDASSDRVRVSTARRIRLALAASASSFDHLDMYMTYHAITYTISGSLTGVDTAGGTVTVNLHRADSGEIVLTRTYSPSTATIAYSFVWFDNTEDMYVTAYQDNTHVGRSGTGLAT